MIYCKFRTRDVSQSSLLPRTRLPMVMWKYALPLLQLEIFVNGYDMSISWKHTQYDNLLETHVNGLCAIIC